MACIRGLWGDDLLIFGVHGSGLATSTETIDANLRGSECMPWPLQCQALTDLCKVQLWYYSKELQSAQQGAAESEFSALSTGKMRGQGALLNTQPTDQRF